MMQTFAQKLNSNHRRALAAGAFTLVAAAASVSPIQNHLAQKARLAAAETEMQDNVCGPKQLCDNTQIKLAIDSGRFGQTLTALAAKHAEGKISPAEINRLQTKFAGHLDSAEPTVRSASIPGMTLMMGPQNAGKKAHYGVYALVQSGKGCATYSIDAGANATEVKIDQNAGAILPVGSHAADSPHCVGAIGATSAIMMKTFKPMI